jgi:hypothetical protein
VERIDRRAQFVEVGRREEPLDRDRDGVGIAEERGAIGEGAPLRFGENVARVGVEAAVSLQVISAAISVAIGPS